MCTAKVRHCVVSKGTNIVGMQYVDSCTLDMDCHGRATWLRMVYCFGKMQHGPFGLCTPTAAVGHRIAGNIISIDRLQHRTGTVAVQCDSRALYG